MTYRQKNRCRPNGVCPNIEDTKNHKNKGQNKSLSLIFKQGTKQNYVIQKQELKIDKAMA
jgi:hypothetical protein